MTIDDVIMNAFCVWYGHSGPHWRPAVDNYVQNLSQRSVTGGPRATSGVGRLVTWKVIC
jgi:hypothetical protein